MAPKGRGTVSCLRNEDKRRGSVGIPSGGAFRYWGKGWASLFILPGNWATCPRLFPILYLWKLKPGLRKKSVRLVILWR